ncbi:DUF1127 domain-containing protein [Azospirillum halopraeferens]|uniref:DUF1127 domain-containing protein n=1 Tax=Azospirillum halopraeferens TaxID=34010 RepID=UPI0006884A5D|nr:DUF1127 domain-containing protein [Azospirillum halopraeferens]
MRTNEAARTTGSLPAFIPALVRAIAAAVGRPALWVLERMLAANDRWRQRQALLRLDDHLLKDIGLTRADAEGEGGKPFWKE